MSDVGFLHYTLCNNADGSTVLYCSDTCIILRLMAWICVILTAEEAYSVNMGAWSTMLSAEASSCSYEYASKTSRWQWSNFFVFWPFVMAQTLPSLQRCFGGLLVAYKQSNSSFSSQKAAATHNNTSLIDSKFKNGYTGNRNCLQNLPVEYSIYYINLGKEVYIVRLSHIELQLRGSLTVTLQVWSSFTFRLRVWGSHIELLLWGSLTVTLRVWSSFTFKLQVWGSLTLELLLWAVLGKFAEEVCSRYMFT